MARLWPEADSDSARRNLNEAVYVIRKEHGEGLIDGRGDELALDATRLTCDLWEFDAAFLDQRWDACLAAYGGPFLDGVHISDAPEFERWCDEQRAACADRFARACIARGDSLTSQGDHRGAIDVWRRFVAQDALSGTAVLRLARSLAANGDRASAIQAIGLHEQQLRAQLETQLDPDLEQLRRELRTADRPVGATAPAVVPTPAVAPIGASEPTPPAVPVPAPARARVWRGVAATALVAAAAMVFTREGTPDPGIARVHLVVTPFADRSASGDEGPSAEGLTQDVIDRLSGGSAFTVASWNAVRTMSRAGISPDSIARAVQADWVIDGSLDVRGESLRVVTRLLDARTDRVLGIDTVERPLNRVATVADDVIDGVVRELRVRLGREVRLREVDAGTTNETAKRLHQRARSDVADALELAQGRSVADVRSAVDLVERADSVLVVAESFDPSWSAPLLERARLLLHLEALSAPTITPGRLVAMTERLDALIAQRPELAPALELRGRLELAWIGRDTAELARATRAVEWLRRAITIDSTLAGAHAALSLAQSILGQHGPSLQSADRALRHDAFLEEAQRVLTGGFYAAYALDSAPALDRWCERGRAAFPGHIPLQQCALLVRRSRPATAADVEWAWREVARLDSLESAERASMTGREYSPLFRRAVATAITARAGERARARRELADLRLKTSANDEMRLSFRPDEAVILLALADTAGACATVDVAYRARALTRSMLEGDPALRALTQARCGRS
ncbi:MAG: hypothetical protein JNL26_03060 [Gemmatimonadetes bacterium]|nr:hypothetical protein [Gemmatimonadota bacterium]